MADPTGLTVDTSDSGASLEWDAATLAGVADYTIFRRTPPTGVPFVVGVDVPVAANVAGLTYDDTGLIPATAYEWQVFGRVPAIPPVAPTITSANSASWPEDSPASFTVTATGTPTPTLSVSGTLPSGVTFTPATGVLAGTPPTPGTFPLTFTAANGTLPDATQSFTLTVTAVAWSPLALPGLVGWWDASDLASITASAGAVSQWADKSGHGFHLTQGTGANQPMTGTITQNGLNVLRFDGVNDKLHNTAATGVGSNPVTLYAVIYVTGGADFHSQVANAGASNVTAGLGVLYSGLPFFQSDYGGNVTSVTVITAAAHQMTLKGGSTLTIYRDGASDAVGGSGAAAAEAGFHVGYLGYSTPGPLAWVAEVFYANVNNADADRLAAEAYLRAKWGTP